MRSVVSLMVGVVVCLVTLLGEFAGLQKLDNFWLALWELTTILIREVIGQMVPWRSW